MAYPRPVAHVNHIPLSPLAAITTSPPVVQGMASTVMQHILSLNEQDRQSVINNLLLMGMGGLTSAVTTPQINVIGLGLDFDQADVVPSTLPPPFLASFTPSSDAPPPCPPCSPHRPHSPQIEPQSLTVVEDDNPSGWGVKTSSPSASVFTLKPTNETPPMTILREFILPAPAVDESPLTSLPRPPCSP
ncbi:hypothetical protein EDB86DRAFT_2836296 [Lactarius hatsudake]|nr:hypothetical protein EDB86DRAFT_2836296 [Lactarius hatsudake]